MLSKISRGIQKGSHIAAQKGSIAAASRSFSSKEDQLKSFTGTGSDVATTETYLQFSRAPTADNFGDLPRGEIPEPLKFTRPFQSTTLSNGIRVCTEKTAAQTATVGVYLGAGSRHDHYETTGSANLLANMLTKGSAGYSKAAFAQEVEGMGARLSTNAGREVTSLNMQCMKGDVSRAVRMLTDAVANPSLDSAELELAKLELAAVNDATHKDMKGTTMESCHYNAFRDHQMGQPVRGDPDMISGLTTDVLSNFRAANYFGDNMVVVGTGNIDHDAFVEQVNEGLHSVGADGVGARAGTEKCVYVPALLMMRDDEMYNANVGVFYDAPGIKDPDYYAFKLMQHMNGNYRIDKHGVHLNHADKQYNAMHSLLADLVDVTMADCEYLAYSDCGLWGNYFYGNEVFTRSMNFCGITVPTTWGEYVTEVEVVRGRNSLWTSLMQNETSEGINTEIGNQMLHLNRRVTRSEIASRVSYMDAYHIKHLANKWFYDAEPSFTNWGAIEQTSSIGSYKYFKVNTMNTVMNTHHSLAS